MKVLGLILAGGQSRRMGGKDKAFIRLKDKPLIDYALARLAPQVAQILINSNAEQKVFASCDVPIIADSITGFLGPLAGIHAGLTWAKTHDFSHMVSISVDAPFFPHDLVKRLCAEGKDFACAHSNGRAQPVFGLWPAHCLEALEAFLQQGGRKVDAFTASFDLAKPNWPPEFFFNINTPTDLQDAEKMLDLNRNNKL